MARIVLLTVVLGSVGPALAEDKADEQAKQVVAQFMKALKAKDLDALMKTVDAPWFHDGKKVIRDRDGIKKEFQQLFEKNREFANLTYEVKQIAAYKSVRTKTNDEERKLLDEVLGDEDRVVLLQVDNQTEKKETVVLVVRLRDGKAHVVGIKN